MRYTNASLADSPVPVNADISHIVVDFIDEHDPYVNTMGVKDIGAIFMQNYVHSKLVLMADGQRSKIHPVALIISLMF